VFITDPILQGYRLHPVRYFKSFSGLVSALAMYHSRDQESTYIHYDIKPANVLATIRNDQIVLALGDLDGAQVVPIANIGDSSRYPATSSGWTYAAPEAHEKLAYCRSDVFSMGALGLVLYAYARDGTDGVAGFEELRLKELQETWGVETQIPRFYHQTKNNGPALLKIVDDLLREMEESEEFSEIGHVLRSMMEVELDRTVDGVMVPGRIRSSIAAALLSDIDFCYPERRSELLARSFSGYRIPPQSSRASAKNRVDLNLCYPI